MQSTNKNDSHVFFFFLLVSMYVWKFRCAGANTCAQLETKGRHGLSCSVSLHLSP